jgi:ATP-dependent protease ClpP protease subunit
MPPLSRIRTVLLLAGLLALAGVVVFSVLHALHPDVPGYLYGQIASAAVILISAASLHNDQRAG